MNTDLKMHLFFIYGLIIQCFLFLYLLSLLYIIFFLYILYSTLFFMCVSNVNKNIFNEIVRS